MEASYTDIFDNRKEVKDEIDLRKTIDSLVSAGASYRGGLFHQIEGELEDIRIELKNLREAFREKEINRDDVKQ